MSSASSSSGGPAAPADPHAALAQLQQQMQGMQQAMQASVQHAQQQSARVQQLEHALAGAAAVAPAHAPLVAMAAPIAARSKLPRIAPPPAFLGVMGVTVDDYIAIIDQQHAYYGIVDAKEQLMLGTANMQSGARKWLTQLASPPASWLALVALLRERYRPMEIGMTARQNLQKMRQTGSVNAYSNAFQNLMVHLPNMHSEDTVHAYITGLKAPVAEKLWEKIPATIEAAIVEANATEARLGFAGRGAAVHGHAHAHYGRSSGASSSSASSSTPMDINRVSHSAAEPDEDGAEPVFHDEPIATKGEAALLAKLTAMEHRVAALFAKAPSASSSAGPSRGSGNRVPGLKAGDITRLMKEGRCFKCKKTGHVKRDCDQQSKN